MPRRWPRPHGISVSSARTPRLTRSAIRGRVSGSGGARGGAAPGHSFRADRSRRAGCRGRRSRGRGAARRPPRGTGFRSDATLVPGPMPCSSPSGMSSVRPPRKPTTSVATGGRSRPSPTMHTSPISTCTPVASMISPIRSRPGRRGATGRPPRAARIARARRAGRAEPQSSSVGSRSSAAATISRARASWVSMPASMSPASVRAIGPAAGHAAVGLHAEMLDPAELGLQLVDALADQLEVGGVDDERDPPAVAQMAQRVAGHVDHALGLEPTARRPGSARPGAAPARPHRARARSRAGPAGRRSRLDGGAQRGDGRRRVGRAPRPGRRRGPRPRPPPTPGRGSARPRPVPRTGRRRSRRSPRRAARRAGGRRTSCWAPPACLRQRRLPRHARAPARPASSSLRTMATIRPCASSTTRLRCGGM